MKKTIALLLSLCMLFALCACGGSGKTEAAAPAEAAPAEAAPAEAAPAEAAPAEAAPAEAAPAEEAYVFPVKADFPAGPEWDGSEPTADNGDWAQAYAVMAKLAEDAKAFEDVKAQYTFTLACHDPIASAPGEFLTAWADAVTIATEGAVDFNIGFSGALSGTMASLDDMKTGTIDFDWTLPCYFKGYMPYTNVIQNPGLGIKNATVGSQVMWDLYKEFPAIQDEFADDGELLFVWANCTSPLSYKGDHEIPSSSEITGNIRANNGPAQMFVTQVGASVFGCPIGDVYTNVSTGVINYLVTDWHGISSFALFDEGVLNYYVDTNVGCSAYCLMANSDVWASIPADIQEQIKSVSGDYLLNMVDIWNCWEAKGRFSALSTGGDIFAPSDELAADLQTAYEAVAETWIGEQADSDLARQIYDRAAELVASYS